MDRDDLRDKINRILFHVLSNEERADKIAELIAPILADAERCKKGLIAVKDLIENSYGVVGLHLNGDSAPWDSLLAGGQFENWLKDFSEAIKEKNDAG